MLGRLLERAANQTTPISMVDWAKLFRPGRQVSYGGQRYQAYSNAANAAGHYDTNSVVFACEANRLLLFSEARFQYQRMRDGRPVELWGDQSLALLEEPWPGHSTRDLLARAELDIFCAGNSYWVNDTERPGSLLRLEPGRVTALTEATSQDVGLADTYRVGERLLAYLYEIDRDTYVTYLPEEVGHYMPYPDERHLFRGKSWLNSCLPDVEADCAITEHKRATVLNGGQLGYVVTFEGAATEEQFDYAVKTWKALHDGPQNAGKTAFLTPGADVKTVGQSFENLALKATQGAGETRIASASLVPAVLVGISEGLSGSSLNQGNYAMARRQMADRTLRPHWGFFASAMQSLLPVQSDSRLWYDDRDIPFLREDVTDQAQILSENAGTLQKLVQSGFGPDAAVKAVQSGDLSSLVGEHSGLFSVQLQPPTTADALSANDNPSMPAMNGATNNG